MKKLLLVTGLVLLVSALPALAQSSYYADYFANNAGPVPGAPDQVIRLINVGLDGSPLGPDHWGDVCANIYVFDNNQEMIACCACRWTPNGLLTASVGNQLTNNPVTSVVPTAGVIKIVPTEIRDSAGLDRRCDPTAPLTGVDDDLVIGYATHVQVSGGATYLTETLIPDAPLGGTGSEPPTLQDSEVGFLPQACAFAQYLGSGKGTCSCSVPGL
jgi:hypothetical protein